MRSILRTQNAWIIPKSGQKAVMKVLLTSVNNDSFLLHIQLVLAPPQKSELINPVFRHIWVPLLLVVTKPALCLGPAVSPSWIFSHSKKKHQCDLLPFS